MSDHAHVWVRVPEMDLAKGSDKLRCACGTWAWADWGKFGRKIKPYAAGRSAQLESTYKEGPPTCPSERGRSPNVDLGYEAPRDRD